jgi:hypothetical protein
VELVRQAKTLSGDVRATVLHLNWDAYAEQHAKLFGV